MKEKVLYVVIAIIFIVAIIMTAVVGFKVDLNYAEGYTITFTVGKEVKANEVKDIAKEVFGDNNLLVQEVEMFNDSVLIKMQNDVTDEELQNLSTKINEKYESDVAVEDIAVEHNQNVKLRTVVEPYIAPLGLSTLLVVGYYAIRYKGIKKMLCLLKYLVIVEGLLYSLYAICRIPVNELTMPIAVAAYALTVLVNSTLSELSLDTVKERNEKNKPE